MDAVDNDFHKTFDIFKLFDGMEVPDLDQKAGVNGTEVNGQVGISGTEANGQASVNGTEMNGH